MGVIVKPRIQKVLALVIVAALSAWALVSCSLIPAAQHKADEVLTIATPVAPSSLNPALALAGRASAVLTPAYEPLVRLTAKGDMEPGLAQAWSISENLDSISFTLRPGALFSNGEAVTAGAVKASVEYFQRARGPYAALLKDLREILTPSDSAVTFSFSAPQPGIASLFSSVFNVGDIIAPAAIADPGLLSMSTFGAGPYVLDTERTIPGSRYVFTPNAQYVNQQSVQWPGIEMTIFADQNQAMTAFKNGHVMLMVADPMTAQANVGSLPQGSHTYTVPAQWSGIVLSDRAGEVSPALGDVRVRRALNYATDRQAIDEALWGQFATPSAQLQVEGYTGFDASLNDAYPYDPEKAKALLAEAGYPNGFPLPVGYLSNSLNEAELKLISAQWSRVNVQVVGIPVKTMSDIAVLGGSKKVGALLAQSFAATPDIAFSQTLSTTGVYNIYGSADPDLTALITKAKTASLSGQQGAWKSVSEWVVANAWFDVVASIPNIVFASAAIRSVDLGRLAIVDPMGVIPQ